jgi:hypothetical protein
MLIVFIRKAIDAKMKIMKALSNADLYLRGLCLSLRDVDLSLTGSIRYSSCAIPHTPVSAILISLSDYSSTS